MTTCHLLGLYPQPLQLPAPNSGESYAVFKLSGFSESGVQAFLRLVPALGLAMAHTALPLDKVERVAQISAALCTALEDGRLDGSDWVGLLALLSQLSRPGASP